MNKINCINLGRHQQRHGGTYKRHAVQDDDMVDGHPASESASTNHRNHNHHNRHHQHHRHHHRKNKVKLRYISRYEVFAIYILTSYVILF